MAKDEEFDQDELDEALAEFEDQEVEEDEKASKKSSGRGQPIDRVREAMAASKTRELEKRLNAAESRFDKSIRDLQSQTRQIGSEIDDKLSEFTNKLSDDNRALRSEVEQQLTDQKHSLAAEMEKLTKMVEDARKEFAEKVENLTNSVSAKQKDMFDQINGLQDQLMSSLGDETKRMNESKVDTDLLAELLIDFASKLRPIEEGEEE